MPSQIMWINIPSISMLHWHPVSVADVSLDSSQVASTGPVTVHFKAYGAWTKSLVKELASGHLPLIRASGPFGCSVGHKWGSHKVLVIFAGGIGVSHSLLCTRDHVLRAVWYMHLPQVLGHNRHCCAEEHALSTVQFTFVCLPEMLGHSYTTIRKHVLPCRILHNGDLVIVVTPQGSRWTFTICARGIGVCHSKMRCDTFYMYALRHHTSVIHT